MKRFWRLTLAILGAGLLLAGSGAVLPVRAAETPAKTYTVKAGRVAYDADQKVYHLTATPANPVVFTQDKVTMTMDQCDYDDERQTAVGTGHLKITDPDSTITGDTLKVDFNAKFAQIIANVTIVTQKKREEPKEPAPAEGEKTSYREKKTTITCPQIDYYYADDKKQGTVVGSLKAVQEDKTVYSDKAFYDGVKDEVTLEGSVRLVMQNGNEFRCPKAIISLKTESFSLEDMEGLVVEEKKPPEPPPPPPPAPSPPANGGG